jgi:hypothetical protein
MPSYRIYFRKGDGIAGRDDFEAENDRDAMFIATLLCDACSDVCDTFELWDGARQVDDVTSVPTLSIEDVRARAQETVLTREIIIRDSHWQIAKSRRLLEHVTQVRGQLRE